MLTGRAWAVVGAGALLWAVARFLGSSDLHMASLGLIMLIPFAALLVRLIRPEISALRRLSTRRAFPGTRVRVEIEVHNLGRRRTPLLLVQDDVPSTLGAPARGALGELRPNARGAVSYSLVPRLRGRYRIGPLRVWAADPFDLVRRRIEVDTHHDLIVYPEVEDLIGAPLAAPLGGSAESSVRQLFRSGEDFYTMRGYEEGDDLRRIHWPSVARTGELMIRQDEASRRAAASVFVDTRTSALGASSRGFERGLSAAASLGSLYLAAGYRLRLATPDLMPAAVDRDDFLERLALARPSRVAQATPSLQRLGSPVSGGGVIVVTHVPGPAETATLSRIGAGAGSKLAVLVPPWATGELLPVRRATLDQELEAARRSLARAGWEVLVLFPDRSLGAVWRHLRTRPPIRIAASS